MSRPRPPIPWPQHVQWHVARTLFALDALVFRYRWRRWTRLVYAVWPARYSRECPPWAMALQDTCWPWHRRRRAWP